MWGMLPPKNLGPKTCKNFDRFLYILTIQVDIFQEAIFRPLRVAAHAIFLHMLQIDQSSLAHIQREWGFPVTNFNPENL